MRPLDRGEPPLVRPSSNVKRSMSATCEVDDDAVSDGARRERAAETTAPCVAVPLIREDAADRDDPPPTVEVRPVHRPTDRAA